MNLGHGNSTDEHRDRYRELTSFGEGSRSATRHERFLLTESNQAVMNIKIQVLEIFDLIFDLRVHVRMNKLATRWKRMET